MRHSTQDGFNIPPSRRAWVHKDGVPALGRSNSPPFPLQPFWEEPWGVADGVGHINTASRSVVPALDVQWSLRAVARREPAASVVTGVGHNEHALPPVGCADVAGPEAEPLRIVPDFGQVAEDAVEPARGEGSDVLHDRDARS
jgi:hypothetical protein